MSDRDRVVLALFERSRREGKRVYGYDGRTGRGGKADSHGDFRPHWDRGCVEGDGKWTTIPKPS